MTTRLNEAALDTYTDAFEADALRCEVLGFYDVASDGDAFHRWRSGDDGPALDVVSPWGQWVRAQRARNATVRRLRILTGPLTDYLRFELDWIYRANEQAGEEIRVLDVAHHAGHPAAELPELWMLDRSRVAVMHYWDDGAFTHADAVEGEAATPLCSAVEDAWQLAQSYTEYRRARV